MYIYNSFDCHLHVKFFNGIFLPSIRQSYLPLRVGQLVFTIFRAITFAVKFRAKYFCHIALLWHHLPIRAKGCKKKGEPQCLPFNLYKILLSNI